MKLEEKRITGETLYKGYIVNVELDEIILPDGGPARREVVRHPGGVTVLPVFADGTVVLVRQWRYPFMEETLEAPAGKLEPGEDPREAGIRELKEETGLVSEDFAALGYIYPSPGYSSEKLYLYLARGLTRGEACLDKDEFLNVEEMSLNDAVKLCLDGKIPDAKTVCVILKTKMLFDEEGR